MVNDYALPEPPAFLDPLADLDFCYYYAVPKFYSCFHPNTRWIITMIRSSEHDRVIRKMEISPEAIKGRCFQLLDNPQDYLVGDPTATPMFKSKAVLYLTVLGIAIYLKNPHMVEMLLDYRDPQQDAVVFVNEPQFATHLQDASYGDFHSFPPSVAMLRVGCFECAQLLLKSGWKPHEPIAMPMRRKFDRRVFYFADWLDVALAMLTAHSLYPLQHAITAMTADLRLYSWLKLDNAKFKLKDQFGLIDVDDLPNNVPIIGVMSVKTLLQNYNSYRQMRDYTKKVEDLKNQAMDLGINPTTLMAQVEDYDAGYKPETDETLNNSELINRNSWAINEISDSVDDSAGGYKNGAKGYNNSAKGYNDCFNSSNDSSGGDSGSEQRQHYLEQLNFNAKQKKEKTEEKPYASESTRILHFALFKDQHSKSLQQCLDSINVLVKREFYMNTKREEAASPRSQDIRNTVVLLLNLIQREQNKINDIVDKIKKGFKKFQHLEEHKMMENRKSAGLQTIGKITEIITKVLLQSKEILHFLKQDYPPYSTDSIDYEYSVGLQTKFSEIRAGMVQEFNSNKDAWLCLDEEMLKEASKMSELRVHFRVGKPHAEDTVKQAKRSGKKSRTGMMNTNNCFVTYRKVKPRRKVLHGGSSSTICGMPDSSVSSECIDALRFETFGRASSPSPTGSYSERLLSTDQMLDNLCREMEALLKPMEAGDLQQGEVGGK